MEESSQIPKNRAVQSNGAVHRRLTENDYYLETSAEERNCISIAMASAIIFFLRNDRPVFLENFGVLRCQKKPKIRTRISGDFFKVIEEETKNCSFEKCAELDEFVRARFPGLVETAELVRLVHAKIPDKRFAAKITEVGLKRLVRGFFMHLKHSVCASGFSSLLEPLGDFYALHNRQGESAKDWFAGADIFIKPRLSLTHGKRELSRLQRPRVRTSIELLTAAFAKPLEMWELELGNSLGKKDLQHQITIAIFQRMLDGKKVWLYCTDGLRLLCIDHGSGELAGSETIFQLDAQEDDEVPTWPLKALTISWNLLLDSSAKILKPGLVCGSRKNLLAGSRLGAVFTTSFKQIPYEVRTNDLPFYFSNVLAITRDEAKAAQIYGPERLLTMLERRGLDQVTRLSRPSVIANSVLSEPELFSDPST